MRLLLLILLLPSLIFAEWAQVEPGYEFSFPRDHGAHPNYQTEWWYFTGHLGTSYGFEMTIFRVGINPQTKESIFIGHFALTDVLKQKFYHGEISSRELPGVSSASSEKMQVKLRSWYLEMNNEEEIELRASIDDVALKLKLKPSKPLVFHGDKGISQKGPELGQASLYTSYTRLLGSAELSVEDKVKEPLKASVWFDHEVTSGELFEDFVGWDWFAVQLSTGDEVMLYQLRDKDGKKTEFSSGTYIEASGKSYPLAPEEFSINSLDTWKSDATGSVYPVSWELKVPRKGLDLKVTPAMLNQEMVTYGTTGRNYWEGKCSVSGTHKGQAYVELTGY